MAENIYLGIERTHERAEQTRHMAENLLHAIEVTELALHLRCARFTINILN